MDKGNDWLFIEIFVAVTEVQAYRREEKHLLYRLSINALN